MNAAKTGRSGPTGIKTRTRAKMEKQLTGVSRGKSSDGKKGNGQRCFLAGGALYSN